MGDKEQVVECARTALWDTPTGQRITQFCSRPENHSGFCVFVGGSWNNMHWVRVP